MQWSLIEETGSGSERTHIFVVDNGESTTTVWIEEAEYQGVYAFVVSRREIDGRVLPGPHPRAVSLERVQALVERDITRVKE